MPLTRDVLNRALHWGSVAVIVVFASGAWWQQSTNPTAFPPGLTTIVCLLTCVGIVWCVVDAFRNSPHRWGLRGWVVLGVCYGLVQGTGHYLAGTSELATPLTILMLTANGVVGFAFNLRTGLVVASVVTALFLSNGWQSFDRPTLVWTAVTVLAGGIAASVVIDRLQRAALDVEAVVAAAWRERVAASRELAKANSEQAWDGLVHDKVLGALLLAGRSRSPVEDAAARELAHDALSALATPGTFTDAVAFDDSETVGGTQTLPLAAFAAKLVDSLGLALEWSGPRTLTGLRRDRSIAVRDAVEQAVVNVRRHAQSQDVSIDVTQSGDTARVTIRDRGRGFNPDAERGQNRGIDVSIRGRLTRVGGAAEITSVVGRGTTVTITVPVAGAGDMHEEGALATDDGLLPHEVATWGEEGFKPIYVVAVLTGVVHVYAALSRRDDVRDLGVLLVCLTVVVVALTSLVLLPRSKRRSAGLIAALSSGVPFVATLNLQSPSLANWSYWFIGSVSVITAIVCFRWSVRWAVGVVAATVIGIPMAHLKVGGVVWTGPLADSLPQTFAFFAAAWGVRAALDHASRSIARASAEAGVARVAAARADEAGEVARQRVRELAHVVSDQLQLIARGRLTRETREHCLALEAQARDILVAGPLLTPSLNAAIASARGRGARVILAADRGDLAGSESFQRALELVLQIVPAQGVVRALWRPDTRGRLGSISVVGDLGADAHVHDWVAAAKPDAATAVTVSSDDDTVLLTFSRSHERAS